MRRRRVGNAALAESQLLQVWTKLFKVFHENVTMVTTTVERDDVVPKFLAKRLEGAMCWPHEILASCAMRDGYVVVRLDLRLDSQFNSLVAPDFCVDGSDPAQIESGHDNTQPLNSLYAFAVDNLENGLCIHRQNNA